MGCHFLLQGIFPDHGWNPSLESPALAGQFFATELPGKPIVSHVNLYSDILYKYRNSSSPSIHGKFGSETSRLGFERPSSISNNLVEHNNFSKFPKYYINIHFNAEKEVSVLHCHWEEQLLKGCPRI